MRFYFNEEICIEVECFELDSNFQYCKNTYAFFIYGENDI